MEAGWAYYAFDTAEELDALRKEAEARGEAFAYNYAVREKLATSLALPAEEVKARIDRGDQWVIRFKMPENEVVGMDDLIRGHVEVNTSTLDDKVLYKSADALPTYHLANIVDDRLMEVSHVIRGEEWLPSLPLHYLLYRAFGWTDVQPAFAHLPLLLKPTGGGKLSKRDGDKMGFPVFPLFWKSPATGETARGYREDGYFPEAFINMLALLGWNPGTEQEIFSMQELIDSFSLERVSKSGARFQPDKAKWFNAQYMHRKTDAELAALYQPILREHGIEVSDETAGRAAGIIEGARDVHDRPVGPHVVLLRGSHGVRGEAGQKVLERPESRHPARTARRIGGDRRLLAGKHRTHRPRLDRGEGLRHGTGDEHAASGARGGRKRPGHVRRNVVHRQSRVPEAYRQPAEQPKTR